jgi:hypothetical protein
MLLNGEAQTLSKVQHAIAEVEPNGVPEVTVMWTSTPAIHPHLHIIRFLVRLLGLVRQLNNQVSLFLASYSSYLDNGNMCSILLLRNDGQERNRVAFAPAAFGFQNSSSL